MANPLTRAFRGLLRIDPAETSFTRRGFRCDSEAVRLRLETAAGSFVAGYHAGLEADEPGPLAARLGEIDPELQGFAYEGAGMALTILDFLSPFPWNRRDRLARFLAGPADPHRYIVHIGAGWALARLPVAPERLLGKLHPVLRWLTLDGYGFHEGFFRTEKSFVRHQVPGKLRGYARRAFDQGLGRSLWFVQGAGIERVAAAVATFPPERQGDVWSGVGLAATYAGSQGRAAMAELRRLAGAYAPQLAQGSAFAVEARRRAGNPTAHTELACQVLCGRSLAEAAAVLEASMPSVEEPPPDQEEPHFELWRRQIQTCLSLTP